MLKKHHEFQANGRREPSGSRAPVALPAPLARLGARAGFTLIELLVVIGIVLVLAAIAVLILPSVMERQRATEGASQLQGWLLIAKQRALRDQSPRGIRLNLSSGYVTDLQYVEQPLDYQTGTITGLDPTDMSNKTVLFSAQVDFTGGYSSQSQWLVQPGDYLLIQGAIVYQIQSVPKTNSLALVSPVATAPSSGTYYRIIRQPRPLAGEDTLQLPQDVAIDLANSQAGAITLLAAFGANQYFDILFGPQGMAIGSAAGYDKIIMWVRDTTLTFGDGDNTLVTVYCRTNTIASHPPNFDASVGGGDKFYYPKDYRSSGQ